MATAAVDTLEKTESSLPFPSFQEDDSRSIMLRAWILAGLFFMVVPGTLLGFSNLLSISSHHGLLALSTAWIEGHGHAQVFGWMGSFILGIGFYSFPKNRLTTGRLPATAFVLWVFSVLLRWSANVYLWHWRILLPLTAAGEVLAVLLFLRAASSHKRKTQPEQGAGTSIETWMVCVLSSNAFFLIALVMNLVVCTKLAMFGTGPAFPHALDQRYLVLLGWGFLAPVVWGFSARWLPGLLHTKPATPKLLQQALILDLCGVLSGVSRFPLLATLFFLCAAVMVLRSLHLFEATTIQEASSRTANGVFIRIAYIWLTIASGMSIWAALADTHGGIWGASRHALTVGFAATMVFSVGPRILPHFGGRRKIFSNRLMLLSLLFLVAGCTLRVTSEPLAYEGFSQFAWKVLPISGVLELTAVTLFAVNIALTFLFGIPLVPTVRQAAPASR
jgi:hypothetical protein